LDMVLFWNACRIYDSCDTMYNSPTMDRKGVQSMKKILFISVIIIEAVVLAYIAAARI